MLLLVRHARSTWNEEGRWQGRADPPLSAAGEAQARAAAARVPAGIVAVHASDQRRAARTAELLTGRVPTTHPGLRERDVGPFEGLTRDAIEKRWPGAIAAQRWPEGWEPDDAVAERVLATLAGLPDVPSLVVTHGAAIRCVEQRLGLAALPLPNLSGRALTRTRSGDWEPAAERVHLDPVAAGHRTSG